jgi:CheY-like chemotaxis protein
MAKLLQNAFCHDDIPNSPVIIAPDTAREPLQPKSYGFPTPNKPQISDTHDFAADNKPKDSQPTPKFLRKSCELNGISSIVEDSTPPSKEDDLRVLLVEDNTINLKLLVAYMRKLNLPHSTASNGLEALNAYKAAYPHQPFDVIFMDISMPIMSGIESTKHIRRFEREDNVKPCVVIALTGAANPEARQEAFSSGVDLFLTKPVPMRELKVMLDELRRSGREGLMG